MEKSNIEPNEFWQSLEDRIGGTSVEGEFLSTPMDDDAGTSGVARRDFLKLMGASLALSSMSCVRRPAEKIVPYAKRPDEIIPGRANFYSSTWVHGGEVHGLLVKTREGKPIKLEGNPDHPMNQGRLSARAQAHLLSLYDPDRLRHPVRAGRKGENKKITWDEADEEIAQQLMAGGVAILTPSLASPTSQEMIEDFLQGFSGDHYTWDALGAADILTGQEVSYGKPVVPRYLIEKAKLIVSIDTDFLGSWISPTEMSRSFAEGRKPNTEMSRLIAFESLLTLTGSNADSRILIKPSQQLDVAMGLIHEIVVKQKHSTWAGSSRAKEVLATFANVPSQLGIEPQLFEQIAQDLWYRRGESLVLAGGMTTQTEENPSLQVAVNWLNSILGNEGKTIDGTRAPNLAQSGSNAGMAQLIEQMNSGRVKTLIIHRANPVFAMAADSGFVAAMKKVKLVIYTGDRVDETGALADFVLPDHHDMENWGDVQVYKGVYSIIQPTIRPLYDTRSLQSSLMNWAYMKDKGPKRLLEPDGWHDYLKNSWRGRKARLGITKNFDKFWTEFLQDGVVNTQGKSLDSAGSARSFRRDALDTIKSSPSTGTELALYATVHMGDGSEANCAWLQELPDVVTKNVWDSYVMMSPKRAESEGLEDGQIVRLSVGDQTVEVPVLRQPGLHDEVLGLAVGYGRTAAGSVANGVGINSFPLARWNGGQPIASGLAVSYEKLDKSTKLANPQGHFKMLGRQIVVHTTLREYLRKPDAGIHHHKMFSLYPAHEYKGHRWAMGIDLTKCIGCSACVVACQSENNIPTVGKQYVIEGREMHWIRIDRYYSGGEDNPDVIFQPMLCQHCENASCEAVCPVAATTHNEEGLNEMTYNRCVGTRYCANNCPYKVRRFNWFNFSEVAEPLHMAFNPEVAVRSRGVMEKCSFCTQRITEEKNRVRDEGTSLRDGDIKTACEQTCPTQAIVFGDVNDPESRVSQWYRDDRTYSVLEEVNNIPMVRYKTKIRNAEQVKKDSHHKGGH